MREIQSILYWENISVWSGQLEKIMPELFNASAIEKLKDFHLNFLTADDLSWAYKLLPSNFREGFDLLNELTKRVLSNYTHLRAYHGCRPKDLCSYHEFGIQPLNLETSQKKIYDFFRGSTFTEITEKVIEHAIASVKTESRVGRVFFEANKKYLLTFCGHYVLYGSEYEVGVFRALSGEKEYVQELKKIGIPTLLECNVPLTFMTYNDIRVLVSKMIESYFSNKINNDYSHADVGQYFGFAISHVLPSSLIEKITHPSNVRDPLLGSRSA